jgi:hypothetical protein
LVPLKELLNLLQSCMLGEGNAEFSLGAQTQIVTEAFWVSLAMVHQTNFRPAVARMLCRLNVHLPNLDVTHLSEEDQDELRVLSHGGGCQDCGCFHCMARPHLENNKEELWESE